MSDPTDPDQASAKARKKPAVEPPQDRTGAVAATLGYRVRDQRLLSRAFTHASRCGAQATLAEKLRDANERLEFLGDAVLGAAIAQLLFERFPEADEGQLSRLRSTLASRATLARAIEAIGLLPHCLVGAQMGPRFEMWPDSVKANLMESILAAVHLDGGWDPLRVAVALLLGPWIDDPEAGRRDARMRLQEWSLEHHKRLPDYTCERSGGTDHQPEFSATVGVAGRTAAGRGTSRRRAEAAAAEAFLVGIPDGDGSGATTGGATDAD